MNIVHKQRNQEIISNATKHLVGRKITSVSYMTKEECEANYWDKAGVIIGLDDGSYIYPMADDEGNAPGVLDTTNQELGLLGILRI